MKKIRVLCIILSILFIASGITIRVYLNKSLTLHKNDSDKNNAETVDAIDIFDAENIDELKNIAEKSQIKLYQSPGYDDQLIADGYSFDSIPLNITITKGSQDSLAKFECDGYLFGKDAKVSVTDYRNRITQALNVFAKRFGVEADGFQISQDTEEKSVSLDINDDSFGEVINGKAELSFFIKDEAGHIWALRSRYERGFAAIIIEIYKFMDPDLTADMRYDIDLSQTTTEGQGE